MFGGGGVEGGIESGAVTTETLSSVCLPSPPDQYPFLLRLT